MKRPGRQIVEVVAAAYGLEPEVLLRRGKPGKTAEARQLAMSLIRQHLGWSYPRIGRLFSRDHQTVRHDIARIDERMAAQDQALHEVANLFEPGEAK